MSSASNPFTRILYDVAAHYKVRPDDLISKSKHNPARLVTPRRVAMHLIRETGASYPEIGRFFNRDHSTVIQACRIVADDWQLFQTAEVIKKGQSGNGPCARCAGLLLELAELRMEILQLRARFNGC